MAGLGKGLKALVGSVTPPKKDINPLLKQMEEIFTTSDAAEIETSDLGNPLRSEGELVGRFYSPVYSAIEKMPIGKEGTKGENIIGYLNKRAPNVDKSELESFNINLEPNKKYTREEILALAKERGSPDYTIEKQKYPEYDDTQRQNVSDKEVDYIELTVQGKQNYTRSDTDTHLGGKRNIGHTRISIRQEMPEGGPLVQKITDRPRYLLVEELQSDLSKKKDDLTTEQPESTFFNNNFLPALNPDTDIEQFNREVYYPRISNNFDDLVDEMNDMFNIYVDKSVVATIKDFYSRTFNPELIDNADDVRKIFEDDTYKNQLIKELKDEHNIDAAGKDIETVALDAIRKKSDTSSGETDFTSDGERELSPDEVLEDEIKDVLRRVKIFINNLYVNSSPKTKPKEIQKLPVATRSEYVKRLLLANIAYAKQNNINKIVIPNYKEIARQRTGDLEFVMYERPENDPLRKKYEQSLKEGTTDKLAQEYYEDVFKPIYKDAVKKVLNSLKIETKNAIKTKPKELKYPDLTQPSGFRTSNALEIDITELDYNPKTNAFRFNEGGVVGSKTEKKTQAGRNVYKTPEGEMVSEKSVTFKYKGKWINVPSIHNGYNYDNDTLMLMLEAGLIKPTSIHNNKKEAEQAARKRSDNLKFNKGGTPMMEQQMELFRRGGLNDEGGEIDEVSGNEVPIGGTKKGVRDDVPAMVSEGEFVFSEDVVRYIGLDKLMQLRQQAKMGLKKMEAMGQMGNSDEATMPDDLPFDMADLIIVAGDSGEELEMQEGGFVTRPTTVRRTTQQPTYNTPTDTITTMTDEQLPMFRSVRPLTPAIQRPAPSVIDFDKLMGDANINFKEYRNAEGRTLLVPFLGNSPIFPIPDGYTLYVPSTEDDQTEDTETVEELNETLANVSVQEPNRSNRDDIVRNEFTEAGSWDGAPLDMYIKEARKFTNGTSSVATGIAGALSSPLALFMYGATAHQKKRILATIDKRIQEARGTPVAGQVAELQKIKGILEGTIKPDSILNKITSTISKIFAPNEVKQKTANVAVASTVGATSAFEESLRPRARPTDIQPAEQVQPYTLSGDATSQFATVMQDIADYEMGRPTRIPQETIDRVKQIRAMEQQGVDPFDISQVPPVPTQAVRPAPQIGQIPAAPTTYQSPEEVYTDLERGLITRGGQPIQYLDERDIAREAYSRRPPSQPYEFFESVQLPPETGGMLRDRSAQPIDPLRRLKEEEERQRRTARIQAEDPIAKRAQLASIYQTPSVVAGQPVVIPPTPIVTQTEPVSAYDFTPTTETPAIEPIRTKYTGDPYTYPTTDITKAPYQTPFKRLFMDQPEGTRYRVPAERLLTSGYEMPQGTFGQRMGTVGFKDTQNQMETVFPDQTISGPKADEVSQMPDPYAYMFETPKEAVPTTVAPITTTTANYAPPSVSATPIVSSVAQAESLMGPPLSKKLAPDVSLRPKARPTTFSDAFASARAAGQKTFSFDGKEYTTELAEEKPAKAPAADKPKSGLDFNPATSQFKTKYERDEALAGNLGSTAAYEATMEVHKQGLAAKGISDKKDSGGGGDKDSGGGSDKSIVCTEMYRQTQLVDWQHAMKTWDVYQKRYLTPYHETGYHWLFQPYVKGMRKSTLLTKLGAALAKHRTQHLRYILTKGKAKDDIIGNVWCKIIHPVVYIAGIIKEKMGK